ncbi:hypothetical protein WMY93_029547 [Mugilogobius chulae]|uniref:BTB domain-containing protein n=1 Tax=Mugilogobius chulae TaxID=88201 RepID=A0AAW0MS23_9GOBI
MDNYSRFVQLSPPDRLLAGFQRLRAERKMCDVVLQAGGIDFPCHRALLASSSEYFWALFGETTAESLAASVSLPALTPEGLDAILDFLYSGWLSVSKETLPVVLEAASRASRTFGRAGSCQSHYRHGDERFAARKQGDLLGLNIESMMVV